MTGQASAATSATLVVDDDKAQCGQARFTSIQAAVNEAQAGAAIRVCPGRYAETVTVDKPLRLKGDPETFEAIDCLAVDQPTADPARQAVVVPPDGAAAGAALFDLEADAVDVRWFVLLGQSGKDSPAIRTSAEHSGHRVAHNLIMENTVGASFNSSGVSPSSFDHNCLRDNGWGLSNDLEPLIDARIHHNSTFRTREFGFEALTGAERVLFDHNVSRDPTGTALSTSNKASYFLWNTTSVTVMENDVVSHGAVRLCGGNESLKIIGNYMEVSFVGIGQHTRSPQCGLLPIAPNHGALFQGNTITGLGTSAGIGMGGGALKDSRIVGNVVSGVDGQGIAFAFGNTQNTGNTVRGNTVTGSGANGIWAQTGASGNTFDSNTMSGNGRFVANGGVDARDSAFGLNSNSWTGNNCETDNVGGAICGSG